MQVRVTSGRGHLTVTTGQSNARELNSLTLAVGFLSLKSTMQGPLRTCISKFSAGRTRPASPGSQESPLYLPSTLIR